MKPSLKSVVVMVLVVVMLVVVVVMVVVVVTVVAVVVVALLASRIQGEGSKQQQTRVGEVRGWGFYLYPLWYVG